MRQLYRIIKNLLKGVVAVLLVGILLVGVFFALLSSGRFRGWVGERVQAAVHREAGWTVSWTGLEASGWSLLQCETFSLADERGVWFELSGFAMEWDWKALKKRRIELVRLHAGEVRLLRLAELPERRGVKPESEKKQRPIRFAWPPYFREYSLRSLSCERLFVGAEVARLDSLFRLESHVRIEREQGLAFGLDVSRLDGLSDRVSAGVVLSNGFQEGTAFLDVEESQGSFSYEWLGASFSPIRVQMRGSGRVDDWSGWAEASCGGGVDKRVWRGEYIFEEVERFALQWIFHEPSLPVPWRGSVTIQGPLDAPEAELTAYSDDIDLSNLTGTPTDPLAISAGLCLKAGELTAYAMATGLTHCAVYAECAVPMKFSLNPMFAELERNRSVYGRGSVDLDFQFLSPLLQAFQQNADGVLQGHVALGGTLDEPEIQGSMNMVDGLYENYIWGTLLRAVQLDVRFSENRLLIERVEAQDGAAGTVMLSGDWSFGKKQRGPPLNLHLRANQAALVNQPTLQLTLGADIRLSGGLTNLMITGTTVVEKASVNIQQTMPPDVADMNIVEINKPGTPPPVGKRDEKSAPRTRLNLEVVLPGRLYIFGRGLTSEWKGQLRVEGAAEDPQVIGEVRLVKGALMFLGKRLNLTDCSITFDGNRPVMPQVELRAFAITSELTAYLRVYGPASNIRVEISSDPVRPQDEVLSMLLFGKRADQLSATEALRMAYGIQVLRGDAPGDGWMNRLQTTLQLDQVGLRQNAQDQTQLAVGRYFGDYLYVEGEKSLHGDADTLMVEINLTPSLQLRAKAASEESAGQSVYLHWRHDY